MTRASTDQFETGVILVTGATGMLGRSLVPSLLEAGKTLPRIVTRRPATAVDGVEHVQGPDMETARPEDWAKAVRGATEVIHAAAVVPWTATGRDATAFRANVSGTRSLAEAAVASGVRRFIYVSSLGIHGTVSDVPFRPDDAPAPSGPYAQSKLDAELALREVCADGAMDFVIVRPPLVYGPGAAGKVGMLAKAVRDGKPVPFAALRSNRRQMIGVDNLADVLTHILHDPAASGRILLPADDEAVSTGALVDLLAEACGTQARNLAVPSWVFSAARRIPLVGGLANRALGDIRVEDPYLQDVLAWTPPISLTEGLARMMRAVQ